jgi:sucrose phosphorylase
MQSILDRLYGPDRGREAFARIVAVLDAFASHPSENDQALFDLSDAVLITYADTLLRAGEPPLATLRRFCADHFKGVFSTVHILPFFPYSSDDGFAVTDFLAVRPDLGSWSDIRRIAGDFKLMVDLVANHVSAQSQWFGYYLADKPGFRQLAIEVDPNADLSQVTRPRTLPLLTEFVKPSGRRVHVWTTFSADQVDLNYRSLDVLEAMLRCLLFYVSQGARMIRLDAIAYLWKQIGTTCIHLPQTHDIIRLFRKILDRAAPEVLLVTETNVPHAENISYFGNGGDEAQMVYNFTLPPLLLHALCTGRAGEFSEWARTLASAVTPRTTFFNFTASHDGIGVRPLEGILPAACIGWLAERIRRNGGAVSEKQNPDGSTSPYELNGTYLDALKDPDLEIDPWQVARFLASQAVMLALPGIPGVYIHSLLGTRNWNEGVRRTGRARTINRRRLAVDALNARLERPESMAARIFHPYCAMLRVRRRQPAFHPAAGMQVPAPDDRVFCIQRSCPAQTLYAVTNFGADARTVAVSTAKRPRAWIDLLSGRRVDPGAVALAGYQTVWLTDRPFQARISEPPGYSSGSRQS